MKNDIWDWNKMKNDYWQTAAECSYYYLYRWKKKLLNKVLDLGAGIGRHSILFAENNFDVTAFDISDSGLSSIKTFSDGNNLDIKTVNGDMMKISFKENNFDAVFAYHSIYHSEQENLPIVIDEIHRVIKYGGEAFITMLSKEDHNFVGGGLERISSNTVLKQDGNGPLVSHYYIDYDEIPDLFRKFTIIRIKKVFEYYNNQQLCHYYIHLHKTER